MAIVRLAMVFCLLALTLHAKDLFIVVTPEKTGTHLLTKALTLMTKMEVDNQWGRDYDPKYFHSFLNDCEKYHTYCQAHIFPIPDIIAGLKTRKYKVVFLMRDPRDQLISTLNYIRERGWSYERLSMRRRFGQLSFDDQITEMITGARFGTSIPREVIGRRIPWMKLDAPEVYTAYYENLVGPEGGGTKEAQIAELTGISNFLNLKLSKRVIIAIADVIYGKPGDATFHTGKIGNWKNHFNEEHKDLFKIVFGDQLIELGYEQDYDW